VWIESPVVTVDGRNTFAIEVYIFICKFLVKDTNYQVGNQDAHGRNWYLEDHPSY